MAQTKIRQSSQIFQSDVFDDAVAAGPTLESGADSLQDDLNALRSQMNRLQGGINWYDALVGRSVETLSTDLLGLEQKPLLYRAQLITDISVPAGQNYVILDPNIFEAPTQVAAVGNATTEGAVVAFNATFGTATLAQVTGPTTLQPRNLCVIRDAITGDPILSGDKIVYGLLQSQSAVNGHTFDDVNNRVQITFVREDIAGEQLELVPVADIESNTINYAYVLRVFFDNLPQDAFLMGVFVDVGGAGGGSTLQSVIDAQGGTTVNSLNDTTVSFGSSTYGWTFTTGSGGFTEFGYDQGHRTRIASTENFTVELGSLSTAFQVGNSNMLSTYFRVAEDISGAVAQFTVGDWSVTHNTAATFSNELRAGIANNYVSLGALGQARVESEGGSDLILSGSLELLLNDSYKDLSSWGGSANGIPLADSAGDWDAYVDTVGSVSILAGIAEAALNASREKLTAVVTAATIPANTDLQNGVNIDAPLPAYTSGNFVSKVDVYLNGQLMRNGADAAANFDVYPGTDPSSGEIRFEFDLVVGDVVTVIRYGGL